MPQIEVSFDIDANGILNVSAVDKDSTGKNEKITITNDSGRLSKDDIGRMVNDAEKFKAQDEEVKEKIELKNSLENTVTSAKNTENLDSGDKKTLEDLYESTMAWLDDNGDASPDALKEKKQDVEKVIHPIMAKMYANKASPNPKEPKIEEVD